MTPSDIISNVPPRFELALLSGDLSFFPSTVTRHVDLGVEFEIRLCPALQKKPALPTPNFDLDPVADVTLEAQGGRVKVVDPFAPPYNPSLFVGELRDEDAEEAYVILLNKYSVVPNHFLLVSKEFQSQSSPLLPPDLVQTYLLLAAARKGGKHFFGFYNCGDNSGASQPHKHVQFIPTEDDGPPIERLARGVNLETPDKPFSLTSLPYANHVYRFPSYFSSSTPAKLEQTLSQAFLFLLDLVVSTIRYDPDYPAGKPSYNVLVTLEHMHLIPRRRETHVLRQTGEKLSVNALGFSGMLLVKSEQELKAVENEGIGTILRGVGLESVHDLQVAGTSLESAENVEP